MNVGISLILIGLASATNTPRECKESFSQSDYACGQCEEPLLKTFDAMLAKVSSDPTSYSSMEQFLADLPLELRRNAILVGGSRSAQGSTPDSPRILLKSPRSELYVSYTASDDPKLKGHDKIEIVRWDGKEGKHKFQEVSFAKKQAHFGDHAKVSQSCAACHTGSLRPNLDPGKARADFVPPREDRLVSVDGAPSPTSQKWLDVMGRAVEEKKLDHPTRLNVLEVPYGDDSGVAAAQTYAQAFEKLGKIKEAVKDKSYSIPQTPDRGDGPLMASYKDLNAQNSCRIEVELKKHPRYADLKYSIVYALSCGNDGEIQDALPEDVNKQAEAFFKGDFDSVKADTEARNAALDAAKARKQEDFLYKRMGVQAGDRTKYDESDFAMPATYELYDDVISRVRYLLEPYGVKVGQWSLAYGDDFTKEYYAFGDQFKVGENILEPEMQAEYKSAPDRDGTFCDWLKKKSLATIKPAVQAKPKGAPKVAEQPTIAVKAEEQSEMCKWLDSKIGSDVKNAAPDLDAVTNAVKKDVYARATTVLSTMCAMCHAQEYIIPNKKVHFTSWMKDGKINEAEMQKWLASTQKKGEKELTMLEHVERALEQDGRDGVKKMPPYNKLSKDDQMSVLLYMQAVALTGDSTKGVPCVKRSENKLQKSIAPKEGDPAEAPAAPGDGRKPASAIERSGRSQKTRAARSVILDKR